LILSTTELFVAGSFELQLAFAQFDADRLSSILELDTFGTLYPLQRPRHVVDLFVGGQFEFRTAAKIGERFVGSTEFFEDATAKVQASRVATSLIDGGGQLLVCRFVLTRIERVHAAAVQILQHTILSRKRGRTSRQQNKGRNSLCQISGHPVRSSTWKP